MSADVKVLLPYQRKLVEAIEKHKVVIAEKSRRIGGTWAYGAPSVLKAGAQKAAGGMNVFYVAYNLEMTRDFISVCAMWAKAFNYAFGEIEEFLFDDGTDEHGVERSIKAFRITFASGFRIEALSSAPRNIRGKQGFLIIDEGSFHEQLGELMKAAFALLMWGGRVLIISTHNGAENPFNELILECRAGKHPHYHVLRVTFDDAIRDGFYKRVCEVTGETWSPEAEAEYVAEIRAIYGDAAGEELDCIPRQGGGRYLARTLLEGRAVDVPVVRWTSPDGFVDWPADKRIATVEEWCEENLAPLLVQLAVEADDDVRSFFGHDFARKVDLSVFWPLLLDARLRRRTPFVVELRDVPFKSQEQIVFFICKRLPRFSGGAFDATGNGAALAEAARQEFGPDLIAEVKLTADWYRQHMPKMKAALEDGSLDIPKDAAIIDDLRQLESVGGVARIVERTTDERGKRHGDGAIALGLAVFASFAIEGRFELAVGGEGNQSTGAFAGDAFGSRSLAGWTD